MRTVTIQTDAIDLKRLRERGEGDRRVLVSEKRDFIWLVANKHRDSSIAYQQREFREEERKVMGLVNG
jgi:hypothetical protein